MDKDQEQILKYQKQHHEEHKDKPQIWCTLCFPLKTPGEEFKTFWDYMKINHKATMCNGATQTIFYEIQGESNDGIRTTKIRRIIETIVFEKHQEVQDNKLEFSKILNQEFKKRNDFKRISREGSREPSKKRREKS